MAKEDGLFEDKKSEIEEDEEYDPEIYTLTDEDGNEFELALLEEIEEGGESYLALFPVDEDGEETSDEYVILKRSTDENGEETLDTIEDDEEFDRIADIFEDKFADIFYDED
jgi:uncharacterized protein YrzB (UPF0473 family)